MITFLYNVKGRGSRQHLFAEDYVTDVPLQPSGGEVAWCRGCHNEATRAWRERNPEKAASYNLARR